MRGQRRDALLSRGWDGRWIGQKGTKEEAAQRSESGTSLVVQWLRIHLSMQGTRVRSLLGELRSHMPRGN